MNNPESPVDNTHLAEQDDNDSSGDIVGQPEPLLEEEEAGELPSTQGFSSTPQIPFRAPLNPLVPVQPSQVQLDSDDESPSVYPPLTPGP